MVEEAGKMNRALGEYQGRAGRPRRRVGKRHRGRKKRGGKGAADVQVQRGNKNGANEGANGGRGQP